MRRLLLMTIAAAGALAGCAVTHQEVLDEGARLDRTTRNAVMPTALCIRKNAQDYQRVYVGDQRPLDATGGQEVIVRLHNASTPTVIVRVVPAGMGSAVSLQFTPLMWTGRHEFAEHLLTGC